MRTQWNDQLIEAALFELIQKFNRMPSANELYELGRGDLANVIARRGGFKKWSDKMGAEQKGTESHLGLEVQAKVGRALRARGYKVDEMTTKHPFDLLVNDRLRIDVKSSRHHRYAGSVTGYIFGISKREPTCDLYILCCLSDEGRILEKYFIPSSEAKIVTLTITPTGKTYQVYREANEQIDRLFS